MSRSPTSTSCEERGVEAQRHHPHYNIESRDQEVDPGGQPEYHHTREGLSPPPQSPTTLTVLGSSGDKEDLHTHDHNQLSTVDHHHSEALGAGSLVQSPTELHIYRSSSPSLPSANPALVNSYPNRAADTPGTNTVECDNYTAPTVSLHIDPHADPHGHNLVSRHHHHYQELTPVGSYQVEQQERSYTNLSPPVYRIPEACSSSTPPLEAASLTVSSGFTPLHTSSPNNNQVTSIQEETTSPASSTFRLSDFSEPGYKLDLQSGQLQIHLDLSSAGDVLNLTSLHPAAAQHQTNNNSPCHNNNNNIDLNNSTTHDQDSGYINSNYYDISGEGTGTPGVTNMEDTDTPQSAYPYTFNGAAGNGTAGNGGAAAGNNPSSSPYLSRGYDLYSPSLYSQYYHNYPWTQPQGKQNFLIYQPNKISY